MRALSLCTCCRHYPGAATRCLSSAHSPCRISLPRKPGRVGLRIVLFEVCSAFTRVAACTLALSPIRDTLSEGFSHFVTSMTAPVASGWSGRRVGLAPTGKAPPCHGAHPQPTSVKSVGGKKLFACELLHSRMAHPVLTAGNYGGAFGRLPGARTGLKDRCQFTPRAPREMRRRCLQSQTKEAGHDQFQQVNRRRLHRRYRGHVRPGHVRAGLS